MNTNRHLETSPHERRRFLTIHGGRMDARQMDQIGKDV